MPAEYRYIDGTVRAGYYCYHCGQTVNMYSTGHYLNFATRGWTCEANPTLVKQLDRANPRLGQKPHYIWSPQTPRLAMRAK